MQRKGSRGIWCAVAILILASVLFGTQQRAAADSILNVPWNGQLLGTFGEGRDEYVAQSFVALDEMVLSLSFSLRNNANYGNGPSKWRVLLTDTVVAADGLRPSSVLYESGTFSHGTFAVATFTVKPGWLEVTPGGTYMWILDAFVELDGVTDTGDLAIGGTSNPYPQGEFFRKSVSSGTRADHFNSDWSPGGFANYDLAFNIVFVPEPGTALLLASGLAGLALRRRSLH